jgi:phage terminase small subunit
MKEQHRRFVEEYMKDFDATNAAMRVGYARTSAYANSYRLLRHPEIAAAVERAMAARKKRIGATADRVVEEYARIAFADIRRVFDWDDGGKNLRVKTGLSADDAASIREVERSADGSVKLKLYDKKASLDALARHLGLFHPRASMEVTRDRTVNGRDAREVLRERLARLAQNGTAKKTNGSD